jgi:hypothetical protein
MFTARTIAEYSWIFIAPCFKIVRFKLSGSHWRSPFWKPASQGYGEDGMAGRQICGLF